MTFRPSVWYPIAAVLSAINVGAVWFAAVPGEPLHATVHAALAVGFGLWAQRLRWARGSGDISARVAALEAGEGGFEVLDADVGQLRQELAEMQERLDFAERLLAQGRDRRQDGT